VLDAIERLNLNSTAIDVVESKGHVQFDDPYTELVCTWLQLFYDFWCREQTQHEEDTCAIRARGSFVDYVFDTEEIHEVLRADFPDFYFSLRPRLPATFEAIFQRFVRYVEAKVEEIDHASQEMGSG
jgi:hypothetical protein